ncbi:FAD-binding domain-containing protein [Pedobacter mendelii]|uniref:Cryptochrome/DNA photolyase FAD-binding domain-containing protein n=1 Tax=Pedobacter mendelii TaxID=1908240 RepID=A0ABQ2BFJ4_9SPHI|nr:FAD-binding domain-containing protein [Pedobacter mendelii]GGI23397.1 hypothetical protein GCM10008119_07440 [Pedobacter mendelii]
MPEIEFATDYGLILERIKHVDPLLYSRTRNFIGGAVSYLSPYISRGVISLKQVQQEALSKGYAPEKIEKFLQELAWREYYQRLWEVKKDDIWQDLKQVQPDVLHHDLVKAIVNANTGITTIDNQIKRLYDLGYMHNHTRMYVASIACNIAKTHWLKSSKWLYYHLLDGDIASNNCSWQWVAGAFSSKKYYCNQENINRYTETEQRNTFMDRPYEEINQMQVPDELIERINLPLKTVLPTTSLPIIDITRPTIIYNSYNMDPEWRKNENVNRILLLEPSHFYSYPVSEKVINFIIALAKNIPDIQIYNGEISAIKSLYNQSNLSLSEAFISKEHVAFGHYPGIKDSYDWMFPEVVGEYSSFFSYWKRCSKFLQEYNLQA